MRNVKSILVPTLTLTLLLVCEVSWAWSVSFGIFKPDEKVQDSQGNEISDPYSPGINFGHEFQLTTDLVFSPRLGYVMNQVQTKDSYGKYKVDTIYLLYDFLWPITMDRIWEVRFGFGTFLKRIKGEGGTVTVPNGGGTATAYRPSGTSSSYTSSINLGVDWKFSQGQMGWFSSYGMSGEIFFMNLLDDKKRFPVYLVSLVGFF